ncbi:MAG TPA: AAA family ATPase [Polyangiaceae bacterium]|nr:AAA family ATPase [Polyangiaceae bacterium]
MATKVALREFKGNDRFLIESILGEGGMGVVYRARDLKRSAPVALKTMTRLDPAALLRFKKEFRALADIAHPSVVQLYELFAEGDQWFFTMELLEGSDFVSYVRGIRRVSGAELTRTDSGAILRTIGGGRPMSVPSAPTIEASLLEADVDASSLLAIANTGELVGDEARLRSSLLGLLEGMLAIHAAGRLHRDIKPSNVMVTPDARVVLLDFGVVGELGKGSERVEDLVLGTPAYMAPEQARATHVGPAADFYAMGVMLYEALTGQLPFDGAPEEVLYAKQQGRPRPPGEIVDGVPDDLGALCLDLLAPAPQDRPDGPEVMDRLRAARPGTRNSLRPLRPSTTTGSSRAFVGREEELSLLRQGLRRASRGEATVVLVSGASGIGKTTLIQRFIKEVSQTPRTLVLSGRCYEREAVPFKGFDSVVDELSRWLSLMPQQELGALLPAHTAELLRVFPVLRGIPALERRAEGRPETAEPQELRRRAFMALRSLLGAIADDRPLLVHIDDLQWADVDSVALLEQVLHAPGAPALLLVGSFRSEALGKTNVLSELLAAAERLGKGAHVQRLELSRLAYEDCARLAALSLGERAESSPDIVRRIAEESQGLPLFVSELSAWQRTAESSGLISLDAVIQGRVDELPTDGRALLELLSVAGGPLPCALVDGIMGLQESDALRARLRVAKLTRSVESSDRDLVDIYHGRIRDSLLAGLSGERQRSLHARLAGAFERAGGFDPGALVEHFMAAGDADGARRHVLPAAETAERGLAFLRAAQLYRRAIELGVSQPRWQLERSVGDMLLSAGHAAEAAAAFASAVHHAPAAERTALRRLAAEHFLKSGGETEGLRLLREALADVKLGYPETTASAVVSLVGNRARLMLRGMRFDPKRSASASELERIDVAFAASSGLAMFDVVRAADFGARHLLLALDGGEPIRLCRALAIEASGRAAVESGARDGIEGLVRTAESLATRSNDPHAIALARLAAGLVRVFSGEWRAAQSILDAAEQIIRERCRGVHWELANAVAWSMNALILCGELKEAAQRVPEVLREAHERADRFALMHMVYPAAITAIVADDPDTADHIAREFPKFGGEFSDRFTGGHWGSLVSRVSANRYRGQGRQAHAEMEIDFTRIKAAHFLRVNMMRVCTTFERALCALSAAQDGGDQAALFALAERCAKELLADRPDYAAPMGHHVMGCLLAAKGRKEQSLQHLDHAIIGLSRVDMGYLASCAKARRGALAGGEAGRELLRSSTEQLVKQGIVNVERCLEMSAPGFRGAGR